MLHNRINLDYGWRGKQTRQAVRAAGAVVMALGGVMACALIFIHVHMMVAGNLPTVRHIMARLTGRVLRVRTMPRPTLGQSRNSRPQRQTQHQQEMDKETGHHCC